MRRAMLAVLLAWPASAGAEVVISSTSRWDAAHTRIVTEERVLADDGSLSTRVRSGGKVGDVRMIVVHSTDSTLAYVREGTAMSGTPLHWEHGCIYVKPHASGTPDLPGTQEYDVIRQVFDHFETSIAGCGGYLTFVHEEPGEVEARYDGTNAIVFRQDRWCRPASDDLPEECYPAASIAVTNLFHIDKPGASNDGTLLDADIELNAVNYRLAVCDDAGNCVSEGDTGAYADLANTLAHEIGHLVGLEHTCWDMAGERHPVDDQGNPTPSCFPGTGLPPEVTESTMYNFQDPNETKKRTLHPEDVRGLCEIYAAANDPGSCERAVDTDDGWCAVAPGRSRPGGLAGFLCQLAILSGLAALLVVRRK